MGIRLYLNEMSVKEFVNTCKTATGHIQKVAHIPLLLTPCWLELSHMTTHSQGELGGIIFVVMAGHPTKNGWSVTMGGKWYTSKVSASEEANAQVCWWGRKKKNAVEYNLHSWKRESIFLIIGILENARDRWRSEKHRSNNSVDSFKTVDRCRS